MEKLHVFRDKNREEEGLNGTVQQQSRLLCKNSIRHVVPLKEDDDNDDRRLVLDLVLDKNGHLCVPNVDVAFEFKVAKFLRDDERERQRNNLPPDCEPVDYKMLNVLTPCYDKNHPCRTHFTSSGHEEALNVQNAISINNEGHSAEINNNYCPNDSSYEESSSRATSGQACDEAGDNDFTTQSQRDEAGEPIDEVKSEPCGAVDSSNDLVDNEQDSSQETSRVAPLASLVPADTQSSPTPKRKVRRKRRPRKSKPTPVKKKRRPKRHRQNRKRPKKCRDGNGKDTSLKKEKEKQSSGSLYQRIHDRWQAFQRGTRRLLSSGGSDDNGDKGSGDKRRQSNIKPTRTNIGGQHWTVQLLLVLLVLCICVCCCQTVDSPSQPKSPPCPWHDHKTAMDEPQCETDDPGDEITATIRGGIFSRPSPPPTSDSDTSASSSTFPRGRSLSRLVSEEECNNARDHDHEMACLNKAFRRKKMKREKDKTVDLDDPPDPLMEWEGDPAQEDTPLSSNSAIKMFTSPAPDTVGGIHTPDVDLQEETARTENSVICTTCRTFSVPENRSSRSLAFLDDITVHRVPLKNSMNYVVSDQDDEESEHSPDIYILSRPGTPPQRSPIEDFNDTVDGFRGPGTLPRRLPQAKQDRTPTVDSGVGTISGAAANPTPSSPPVVGVEVDISWFTSTGDKEKPVYHVPGGGGDSQSSFQGDTVPATEQTPRSPANHDELVCVKPKRKVQHHLDEQPAPHESLDETPPTDNLQSALQVFSSPSPEPYYPLVECGIPRDLPLPLCVFVGGSSTSYVSRMCGPVPETRQYLTEAKIDQCQQCSLKTFTTHL